MFEELIHHGNSMIRRLERLNGLSDRELVARPAHEQVAITEAETWRETVEDRIQANFGADTLARYKIIWKLYKEEIDRDEGSEVQRALTAKRRIVDLLSELDKR
jgi:hypothetical protein